MSERAKLARMRMLGQEELATRYLAALNQIGRAFGKPEMDMPEPADPRMYRDGLITADASKVTPGEFMAALSGFDDGPKDCPVCGTALDESGCAVGCLDARKDAA